MPCWAHATFGTGVARGILEKPKKKNATSACKVICVVGTPLAVGTVAQACAGSGYTNYLAVPSEIIEDVSCRKVAACRRRKQDKREKRRVEEEESQTRGTGRGRGTHKKNTIHKNKCLLVVFVQKSESPTILVCSSHSELGKEDTSFFCPFFFSCILGVTSKLSESPHRRRSVIHPAPKL